MLGVAPHLPDPTIGLAPALQRLLHLPLDDRPQPVGQLVARSGVEVDRIEHRPPHVVLILVVGAVADPHRPRLVVARQMLEHLLLEPALAADPVHDLELALLGLGHVGDEVEEVVGLLVEAERVQRPQHEGRVAHPAVAVIPVAISARSLGQRRGGGRDHRSRGRVGEPLEGQRAALQVRAPGVVRERSVLEPLLPEATGAGQPRGRLLVVCRQRMAGPAERDERPLAFAQRRSRPRPRTFEAESQIGHEAQPQVDPLRGGHRLVVPRAGIGPVGGQAAVVERRLALELDLGRALHALDQPQQHVIRVVVGRRAPVAVRALVLVVPRPDAQRVAHDHPPHAGLPAGLEHHRPRDVAPARGDAHIGGTDPKGACVSVQDRPEHARRVHPRQAHPLDVAARRDERRRFAVGQERIVPDRREGTDPDPMIRRRVKRVIRSPHHRRAILLRWPTPVKVCSPRGTGALTVVAQGSSRWNLRSSSPRST